MRRRACPRLLREACLPSPRDHTRHAARSIHLVALALLACLAAWIGTPAFAQDATPTKGTPDPRHPLEIEALTSPQEVLRKLPAARAALDVEDHEGRAKLALAEANACRVTADWSCQRRAGSAAMEAADRTKSIYLQVRSRIALGRALSRLGDFSNASRLLTEARQRLGAEKNDALMADVLLAYSSISARLGKLDESYRYAREGLAYASPATQPEMHIRLLRNMAKVASETGRAREAQALLRQAEPLLPAVEDPKLTAEILLEEANAARALGDADTVEERGRRIGAIGGGLENTQIRGLGFETIGHAQRMRGARELAYAEYVKARDAFAGLRLYRDELRAVREIVDLQLAGVRADQLTETTARLMMLTDEVARIERESAAADFEERLRFVQSEAALAAAKTLVENERLRATVSENRFRYSLVGGALVVLLLAGVVGLYWQQRRYTGVMRERGKEMEIAIATDFLTAVHSRRHITEAGHAAVASALAHGHHFAIAVVDIDHFKRINDRFGHAVGDEVLKAVAAAMREVCRDSDTLGRYGGEEFAVLLQGIGNDHVQIAAERLRKAVADVRVRAGDQLIVVTASVGVACLSPDDTGFDTLLIRADRALYRAKSEGRNRVVMADGSDDGASVLEPL